MDVTINDLVLCQLVYMMVYAIASLLMSDLHLLSSVWLHLKVKDAFLREPITLIINSTFLRSISYFLDSAISIQKLKKAHDVTKTDSWIDLESIHGINNQ